MPYFPQHSNHSRLHNVSVTEWNTLFINQSDVVERCLVLFKFRKGFFQFFKQT